MDLFTKSMFFIILLLIYGITLFWDAFKREEPYGNAAYITALLPANYLWWAAMYEPTAESLQFNALGAASVLVTLWLLAMVRDIYTTRKKKKDLDDVVLYLVVAIIIQLILYAVLPSDGVLSILNDNANGGTGQYWGWWVLPEIAGARYESTLIPLWFRIVATLLTLAVIIPMIQDLRGTKVAPWILIVITIIFAIPFAFVAYIWIPDPNGAWLSILFLSLVLLAILLFAIAK